MRNTTTFNTSDYVIVHTENLDRLMADVRRTSILSEEEEKRLMRAYFAIDDEAEKVKIRNIVITANTRFLVKLAHYWGGCKGEKVCEYFSIVSEGVLRCFDLFDLSREVRFLTFAKEWARNYVSQYRRDKESLVYNGKDTDIKKATAYANRIYVREGRKVSEQEVVDYLNEGIKESNKKRKAEGKSERKLLSFADLVSVKPTSLETPMGEDGNFESVGEFATSTASEIICKAKEDKEYTIALVRRCMLCLTDKERQVISLAYGVSIDGRNIRNLSDKHIAEVMHHTKERIRQIRTGAEKKMREFAQRHKMVA